MSKTTATETPSLDYAAPSRLLFALEYRAVFEFAAGLGVYKGLQYLAPRGDGHPILVLPGLGASDFSTHLLRQFLQELGYIALPWGLGVNTGMITGKAQKLHKRLQALHAEHGRKISLVGQSLGGVFARELAKLEPKLIRQVITLGSPFAGHPRATNAIRAYEWLSGDRIEEIDESLVSGLREKPPVPTTSIFSKSDGIVSWHCSVQAKAPDAENIELRGVSHLGMAASPAALYLVADRLAEPEDAWQAFQPNAWQKMLYCTNHDQAIAAPDAHAKGTGVSRKGKSKSAAGPRSALQL
jgi:predicted esterase YcpF (UPF0227 family)